MVFTLCLVPAPVVPIVRFKGRVRGCMGGAARRVHIRRIKHDTVQFTILVGQKATIHAILNVGCQQLVFSGRNISPENSLSIGNVCDNASTADVKLKNLWEYGIIAV